MLPRGYDIPADLKAWLEDKFRIFFAHFHGLGSGSERPGSQVPEVPPDQDFRPVPGGALTPKLEA